MKKSARGKENRKARSLWSVLGHAITLNLFLLSLPVLGMPQGIQLPQTGQAKCYNASGVEVVCTNTGQDGAIQAGISWPSPRFTDNADQTKTDLLTGLVWTKDADAPGPTACSPGTTKTWQGALDHVACLNAKGYLGHSDWRMPNINELESLVHQEQANPGTWLNQQGFANVYLELYWSSTTSVLVPSPPLLPNSFAWGVHMVDGNVFMTPKTALYRVWPVRSAKPEASGPMVIWRTGQQTSYYAGDDGALQKGAAWPPVRFTDKGDQTVADNLTGLIWTKDASAPGPPACNPGTIKMWQEALEYVACLNANAYLARSDWRLPNRKELYSLTDFSRSDPSLQSANPFVNVAPFWPYFYWSSTTYAHLTTYAWYVQMKNGFAYAEEKTGAGSMAGPLSVWPVRGGQPGFSGNSQVLAVFKSGAGTGSVTASPAGIDCGLICSAIYGNGSVVMLSATPGSGSTFAGWSGAGCAGTTPCTVTMAAARSVTAVFDALPESDHDFDGDGRADILWRDTNTGEIFLWLMNGATKLSSVSLGYVADVTWKIAGIGDFNADGKPDILWRNFTTGENYVWFMDGTHRISGAYWVSVTDLHWRIVGTADFNGDGNADILWRNSTTGDNYVWFMSGITRLRGAPIVAVPDPAWNVAGAADFNGDGKPDILWRNTATGENYLWLMDGTTRLGGTPIETLSDVDWNLVGAADFNGDHQPDLLWRNLKTGENRIWLMAGATHLSDIDLEKANHAFWLINDVAGAIPRVTGSDFNGDAKPDILWRNSSTGEVAVWWMSGSSRLGYAFLETVLDLNWKIAGSADFDGNGKPDILWRNSATGEIYVWFMNGTARNGGTALESVTDLDWEIAGLADFNGDGKPDILWRNSATGANTVWYMNGASHVGDASVDALSDLNWRIVGAADFGGDGKPDILWRNSVTGENGLWLMNGVTRILGCMLESVPDLNWKIVNISDFDGDGYADILWRNAATGENYIWFMTGSTRIGGIYIERVSDTHWLINDTPRDKLPPPINFGRETRFGIYACSGGAER